MIYIDKQLESMSTDDNPIKLFNVLPLRTRITPSYITLDTTSIILLLMDEKKLIKTGIVGNRKIIWKKFFKTEDPVFKKTGYKFNFMIKTDGISCSILFVKLGNDGKPIKEPLKQAKNTEAPIKGKYIEDQSNVKHLLENKNYVCIDPNLSDLMYCRDKNGKMFRYTQKQRNSETKNKHYMKITEKINGETKINGKSITEIQSELSIYNSKTASFDKFMEYLKIKNKINEVLFTQYCKEVYRKLKWYRYINTQKTESKLVKNFENKFGNPSETKVIIGDYDKGSNHMKGKEPVITKRLRTILKRRGYDVYLINEFRTSKLCSNCHSEVERFMKRKLPQNNKEILVWGLVRCKNEKCHQVTINKTSKFCGTIFNRDMNAVLNMHYIVKSLIDTGNRPVEYTRIETKTNT